MRGGQRLHSEMIDEGFGSDQHREAKFPSRAVKLLIGVIYLRALGTPKRGGWVPSFYFSNLALSESVNNAKHKTQS